jgi:hypothetical protein
MPALMRDQHSYNLAYNDIKNLHVYMASDTLLCAIIPYNYCYTDNSTRSATYTHDTL